MRPVDPRLIRETRATRRFLAASVALGLLGAVLLIAQAVLIAELVTGALAGDPIGTPLLLLAVVSLGRALLSWLTELSAHRASAAVMSELRLRLLEHATRRGGRAGGTARGSAGDAGGRRERSTGELTTLATRGVDALDGYFSRYLPQLGLAVTVPVAVLALIVTEDWVSALVIAVTLPLIPVFMVLVGWATQARTDRQWRLLTRLSGHFLDVVAGLPTLKVFGRARAQAGSIRSITADYRRATLGTLRIAFLSSFVLELLATLSVALVAVGIGMRLVHGELDLHTGLVVLVLAPEAYVPLRQVGTQYHAAAEGLSAADEVFAVTGAATGGVEAREAGSAAALRAAPDARTADLTLEGVEVHYPGRTRPALPPTTLTVRAGETLALVGPSGTGKSTLVGVLLGLVPVRSGQVLVGGVPLSEVDLASWHAQVSWVPQRPQLYAGTVAENVRLARPDAGGEAVRAALRDAGAADLDPELVLGEGGAGLSAGQRQRVALARAFLADRPVLLLDEPTAALDGVTEETVLAAVRRLAAHRTVLLVTHRSTPLAVADRVHRLGEGTAGSGTAPGAVGSALGGTAPVGSAVTGTGSAGVGPDRTRETAAGDLPGTPSPVGTPVGPARHPLARIRTVARPRWARLTLAGLLGALAVGCAVGLMAVSGWLISRAAEQPPVLTLMVAVTATRTFGIGRAVFRYVERLVSHDAVLRLLADLRVAVYRRLERLAPAGLRHTRQGDLLSRLVADVDSFQDYFLRWLLPVGVAAVVGTAAVAFTGWLLPAAGAALAVGLLLAGVAVPALTALVARRTERQLAPARGTLATRITDVLTGTAELTVSGALPRRLAAVRRADQELTRLAAGSAAAGGLGAGLGTLVAGLTVTATAWLGASATADGRLPGLWLATVVLTSLAAFEAVTGLPEAVRQRQRVRRSAERVYEVLDAPAPVHEPDQPPSAVSGDAVAAEAVAGDTVAADAVLGEAVAGDAVSGEAVAADAVSVPAAPGTVALRGLTARYPSQPPGARPALDGLDLELAPGRRTVVVGPSGSGKTTLAQVLLRFLDPAAGSYHLAGRDALGLSGDEVRRTVGLCAQDAHLFDSSLRENLRLARPTATDGELREALAAARLLDWVDTLPRGLDTLVGEHGSHLSGGQRQRLALARALLADFPVLLLDEPAEHLDLDTADALTRDLLAATEDRTTVLITHRLAVLAEVAVDEVLVLDEGRVVQRGRYRDLAAVDGPFRRLLQREERTPGTPPTERVFPLTPAG